MPDEPTIGVDERELDDLALEALAEAYATTPAPGLRQRVLGVAHAEAGAERARRGLNRWRSIGALAATVALALTGLLARENGLRRRDMAQLDGLAQANAELTARLDKLTIKVDRPQLSPADIKKFETAMRNNKASE